MLMLFSILALAYFTSAAEHHLNIKDKCPSPEDIQKCSCEIKYGGIRITCSGLETDSQLLQHLKGMEGYTIAKLQISKYTAASIPTDLFNGLEIKHLSLERVEVKDASFRRGKRHFEGLEDSLTTLEITKSFRVEDRPLLNLQLDHLKNLQVVMLEDNNIPEVGDDWFASGPDKLDVLIFERNNIEVLGEKAFSSLHKLKTLAIAGNHLQSISRSMLPKMAHKLTTLDLAYNKIRTLPTDIFSGMVALQDLNLENNLIHRLQLDTWEQIFSRLDSLKLGGNALQCDDEMKWICEKRMPTTLQGKCGLPQETKGLSLQQFCKQ